MSRTGCKRNEGMKSCDSHKTVCAALALFVLLSLRGAVCFASPVGAPCNIVLITIDTLRADHLSCYGYYRKTSPNIDCLAAQGIICHTVYAPSSWTAPSMASLFTSVYPVNHGVMHGFGYKQGTTIRVQEVFSTNLVTLAEALVSRGYTTFGVASNYHLSEKFGFERGFDYFTCLPFLSADKVNESVHAWEDEIRNAEKFFLWVHYFDPHSPYTPHEPWIREYADQAGTTKLLDQQWNSPTDWGGEMKRLHKDVAAADHYLALYDSEINYVDAHLGKLLERLNLDGNTLILITSDHGEEFQEHGQEGHGKNLYQETVRVPLVVKLPGHLKGTIPDRHINLVNVMPTILDMVDISPPAEIMGTSCWREQSLLMWLKGKVTGSDRDYSYSELDTKRSLKAVFAPPWKYIHDFKNGTGELYNLAADPWETHNHAGENTGMRDQLRDHLLQWVETARRYPTTKYDIEIAPELKEQLKGLGYLQ
jgi:arylsulfatase A-like enzyme